MLALWLLLAAALILLNAFFVLAEFAAVKIRPSRVDELISQGNPRAKMVKHVQGHLDEYLSVCQVGITFASIGLGFVGEPAFAELLGPALNAVGIADSGAVHGIALTLSYILVSFLHILLGELVPKSLAIRRSDASALRTALPLRIFHVIFYLPLILLNGMANYILGVMGIRVKAGAGDHSEEELRIILSRSQRAGIMSFRRLLLVENVFDLAGLKVRDAMVGRKAVRTLDAAAPWSENFSVIRESRFSRFPLISPESGLPLGIIHVKDILFAGPERIPTLDLKQVVRPFFSTHEDALLENLLPELQHHRGQMALVLDREGRWTGIITFENLIEAIIGKVEDEFESEPPISLRDVLTPSRIILGVEAASLPEAVAQAISRVPASDLPAPADKILAAVEERERAMSTYLGGGLAVPHARLEGIPKPALVFARSEIGVPAGSTDEKAHLIFILITAVGSPRDQVRLLARIVGLMESDYVRRALQTAETPAALLEALKTADPLALG